MLRRRVSRQELSIRSAISLIHPKWGQQRVRRLTRNLLKMGPVSRKRLETEVSPGAKGSVETGREKVPVKLVSEGQLALMELVWRELQPEKSQRNVEWAKRFLRKRLGAEEGKRIAEALKKRHPDWPAKKIAGMVRQELRETEGLLAATDALLLGSIKAALERQRRRKGKE